MRLTELNDLLEDAVNATPGASHGDLAKAVAPAIVADPEEVVERILPYYIAQWMSNRRKWRPGTAQPEPETFAPDDLLSDGGQAIEAKRKSKMLKARGSARVNGQRMEWQRHWVDSIFVPGKGHIPFGEAGVEDLRMAADGLRDSGKREYEGKLARADYYEKVASKMEDAGLQKVSDFANDPTREAA